MSIKVEQLTKEAFAPFGTFYDPANIGLPLAGEWGRNNFFPDQLVLKIPCGSLMAVSSTKINPGPLKIDATEWHDTDEAIGGFTEDTVFHVGLPTWNDTPGYSTYRVFYLPKGWWVRTKRGVWHFGPFVLGDTPAYGTVILPPSTYNTDCTFVTLSEPLDIEL